MENYVLAAYNAVSDRHGRNGDLDFETNKGHTFKCGAQIEAPILLNCRIKMLKYNWGLAKIFGVGITVQMKMNGTDAVYTGVRLKTCSKLCSTTLWSNIQETFCRT